MSDCDPHRPWGRLFGLTSVMSKPHMAWMAASEIEWWSNAVCATALEMAGTNVARVPDFFSGKSRLVRSQSLTTLQRVPRMVDGRRVRRDRGFTVWPLALPAVRDHGSEELSTARAV